MTYLNVSTAKWNLENKKKRWTKLYNYANSPYTKSRPDKKTLEKFRNDIIQVNKNINKLQAKMRNLAQNADGSREISWK